MSRVLRSRRTLIVALSVAALVPIALDAGAAPEGARMNPPERSISWLSIGDSYGAGEGASEATGHCQLSPNAAGPKAATILRTERGWTIGPEVFSACTGHLAADMFSNRDQLTAKGHDVYGSKLGRIPDGAELSNGTSLADWAKQKAPSPDQKFDVITVSLSGNDIGFAEVVQGCIDIVRTMVGLVGDVAGGVASPTWAKFATAVATQVAADKLDPEGCGNVLLDHGGDKPEEHGLKNRVDDLFDESRSDGFAGDAAASVQGDAGPRLGSMSQLYQGIADAFLAPGGVLVVMGYPRLITPSKTWGAWRGDQCNMVSRADADKLGEGAEYYDAKMREAVEGLDERFSYVSRLEAFDAGGRYHSLCGRTVEWINTPLLFLRDGTARYQRAFHPNDLGYLASAEAVAGIVEQRLGTPTPTPTSPPTSGTSAGTEPRVTTQPTVRSSEQHYDIGDDFAATCTVAWPFAPARGANVVTFRTTCPSVPKQFLFVDIQYDDPDLPVTPSHPTVRVEGTVGEILRSEYGFTTLVVVADRVDVL